MAPGRDVLVEYGLASAVARPFGWPAYLAAPALPFWKSTVGMANTARRGSLCDRSVSTKVFDMRWSSRVWKLSDHGLLKTPSPGQSSIALSAFEANTPPGAASAAVSSVLAF